MNILLTGSNGFIGGNVAAYLHQQGHYIVGLGRRDKPVASGNVDEYISCDLSSDKVYSIPKIVRNPIDAVIHLAADMRKEPYGVEVISANCGGTQRLLEMCQSAGVSVFLQLSSLPVIGHPLLHPITEEHPVHPYTIYHITKYTEELLANYASEYHDIRTASFRISAPIGIGCNPNTIFPTFVRHALNNEDIVLLGKGTRQQNYVYVKDIARCLESALFSENVHGIYNLTSNLLISNRVLAETCIAVLHSHSSVIYQGLDATDDYVWDASIERIMRDSGYLPATSIEDVIREYADYLLTK